VARVSRPLAAAADWTARRICTHLRLRSSRCLVKSVLRAAFKLRIVGQVNRKQARCKK